MAQIQVTNSGHGDGYYRSNSDTHSGSHNHHGPYIHHRQHSDGYFRHHIYISRRRVYKWASDPAINKKNFYSVSGYSRPSNMLIYSRSLDYFPYGGDDFSRSPSPAPSSDMDSSSLKDNPVQIYIGADTASLDTLEDGVATEQRSVMSGGTVRGWLPDVSVVLWRRVLGLLGDPNDVSLPQIHEQIFKYLLDLTETLIKLRNNQGISTDNLATPQPSELVPPITLFTQWCFRAFNLPSQYSSGKLLAYRLLCKILVRQQDVPLSKDLIAQFYRVIHQGLVGHEQDVMSALLSGCSPNFFSLRFPGSTVLALDFIYATKTLISYNDSKWQMTRFEAVGLLGSLYPLISLHKSVPVLQPQDKELTLINCSEVKDHLLNVLLKCAKKESYWKTRAQALCALSIYLYHELPAENHHSKVPETIELILASLKPLPFAVSGKSMMSPLQIGKMVSQIASDILLLLTDYSDIILSTYPDLPPKIVQIICQTLTTINCNSNMISGREGQHLILSLMLCLVEWVMALPQTILIQPSFDRKPIMHLVFMTLNMIHTGIKPSASFIKAMRFEVMELTNHIVNHLWQFPLGVGPHRLSSLVAENDDLPETSCEEISSEIFLSPHVQFFALNKSCILSLVQLPALQVPGGAATIGFKTPNSEVRLILRDLSGKFCWDASMLFAPPSDDYAECHTGENTPPTPPSESDSNPIPHLSVSSGSRDDMNSSMLITSSVPRHALRHRSTGVLPSVDDSADDLDNLDDLLGYIGHTSPEILEQFGQCLNEAVPPPIPLPIEVQHEAITSVLNQRNAENEYLALNPDNANMVCPPEQYPQANGQSDSVFQHCRRFFDQLGLAAFDKRKSIFTLRKNEKLLREIKNLDSQKCRETHKLAVIYVAEGQEDKSSILSNSGGSEEFEEFVSGLGWEVELASHMGFMGGLQRNGTTGDTAPYYATSLTEVIFHVSTRMPSSSDESIQKLRHLGNDEVHIVWSEHRREYRRGIIPTEFCDVLIIIYPLENHLYRIQISTKPDVPLFGPLFDGAIVSRSVLSRLVRATALNASRAKRSQLPFYQYFYEDRARSLETIIEHHSESTTFERFIADVYAPVNSSISQRSTRATVSSTTPTLAAALLDRPSQSPQRPPLTRPTSYSVGEHHNVREKVRNALGGGGDSSNYGSMNSTTASDLSSGANTSPSASPRGNSKLSLKPPRKMGMVTSATSGSVLSSSTSSHQHNPATGTSGSRHQISKIPPESPVAPPRRKPVCREKPPPIMQ
ncbi:Ral GTPase-activating protein subunit alpha-1 [Armadillidium nasatum]|uniref:Ral GTPase-activating protein subunit alpha-1 n=1 Tax=Armadillidium nasatum TaxID=96803 RepID=A0A5N5T7F9_9CRUS|nr:Ral GTPase-activating protein subunit alpha-1 [Armadillidium nasatum]